MKKILPIAIIMTLIGFTGAQSQTYKALWEEVNNAVKEDLPKTAVKACDKIIAKAKREENKGELFEAFFRKAQYMADVSPDSSKVYLKELEEMLAESDEAEEMLLHSCIARSVATYARNSKLSKITNISEEANLPSDISEYSRNQLVTKVLQEVKESLKDLDLLHNTKSDAYLPYITQNKAGEYFDHDLLHILSTSAIETLSYLERLAEDKQEIIKAQKEIYEAVIDYYKSADNTSASTLYSIEMLDFIRSNSSTDKGYEKGIEELLQSALRSDEVYCEVLLREAQLLQQKGNSTAALEVCDSAIKSYPTYSRVNAVKEIKESILSKEISVEIEGFLYPGEQGFFTIKHKNISECTIATYRLPDSLICDRAFGEKNSDVKRYFEEGGVAEEIEKKKINLTESIDYKESNDTVYFTIPRTGLYSFILISDDGKVVDYSTLYRITRYAVLTMQTGDNEFEAIVVDKKSGHPVDGATVTIADTYDKTNPAIIATETTGTEGRVNLQLPSENKHHSYFKIRATKGDDIFMAESSLGYQGTIAYSEESTWKSRVNLFTDRELYRPGQNISVYGIAYSQNGDSLKAIANEKYVIELIDRNAEVVCSAEVTSGEMGSFSATLAIPATTLNGTFTIRCDGGATSIKVEEYKRPGFYVTTEPVSESFNLRDTVIVRGSAKLYSGVALSASQGKFSITAARMSRWYKADKAVLQEGLFCVDKEGEFEIPVYLNPDALNPSIGEDPIEDDSAYYIFIVDIEITSPSGETQTCSTTITAGKESIKLTYNGSTSLIKGEDSEIIIGANNLNGEPINALIDYKLCKNSDKKEVMQSGKVESNTEFILDTENLPAGRYSLEYSATDRKGAQVTGSKELLIISLADKTPIEGTTLWTTQKEGEVYVASSFEDAIIFVDLFVKGERIYSCNMPLSNEIKHFNLAYKEEWGDGAVISFLLVRNNSYYSQNQRIERPKPVKDLLLKWEVFRDCIAPGESEEWRLRVTYPDGTPASAEVLAYMYDASLDQIAQHNINFSLNFSRSIPSRSWNIHNSTRYKSNLIYSKTKSSGEYKELEFDRINNQSVFLGGTNDGIMLLRSTVTKVTATEETSFGIAEESTGTSLEEIALREDFSETALFAPTLRTDEEGIVTIAFTPPQSLTTWQFHALAHTLNLDYGVMESRCVAQKEFMIEPNMPRFLRSGDSVEVSATITNLTEESLSADVLFEVFDPSTNEIIEQQTKKVDVSQNSSVSFLYKVTDDYSAVGIKMIAKGGDFSDGEQHLLAVLPNKVNLVESVAMPLRGKEKRNFSTEELFNNHSATATDKSLTIEFAGNPAWYAVSALGTMATPANDCAISWSNTLYANSLASYIATSNPLIKSTLESGGESLTAQSRLESNEELKNILISETPWVLEAKNEREQRESFCNLFDQERIAESQKTAMEKLLSLQGEDGGWPWWQGMRSNYLITYYVLIQNVRLQLLTGEPLPEEVAMAQERGLNFMHNRALEHYNQIMERIAKGEKDIGVDNTTLQYLYLMALQFEYEQKGRGAGEVSKLSDIVPSEYRKMFKYFLSKVGEVPEEQNMQQKAMGAVILKNAGKKREAKSYIKSLSEHLSYTDELGMFFDFSDNPGSFGEMRLSAQVAVIEAFDKVAKDEKSVEEMKIWLLKQKQTSAWESDVLSAEAIYALLCRGKNILDGGEVEINFAGHTLNTATDSPVEGINYIKESYTSPEELETKSVTAEKRDEGIAWGAIYARFDEDIERVEQSCSDEMSISKELYIKKLKQNSNGTFSYELTPLKEGDKVSVGDIVTARLTIKTDRTMEFVQLKEQRGGCMEPITQLSGYHNDYYEEIKDASTNFFFDSLEKGTHILEVDYRVSRSGLYETGLATLQCAYAPEYSAHSSSMKITVE